MGWSGKGDCKFMFAAVLEPFERTQPPSEKLPALADNVDDANNKLRSVGSPGIFGCEGPGAKPEATAESAGAHRQGITDGGRSMGE